MNLRSKGPLISIENDSSTSKSNQVGFDSASNFPEFSTLGLHSYWRDAYDWATKHMVVPELLHSINATQIHEMPNAFGALLSLIISELSFVKIKDWSYSNQSAKLLFALALATKQDNQISSLYPDLPDEVSAARQFHGKLETHYLMAMLTERLPRGSEADRTWLNTLRLWVLTHAIERENKQNIQDGFIRLVASKLRMACGESEEWRIIFLSLTSYAIKESDFLEFDELSRIVVQGSERLLMLRNAKNVTSSQRALLHALIKVAKSEHSKDENNSYDTKWVNWPALHIIKEQSLYQPNLDEIGDDEEDIDSAKRFVGDEAGHDDGVQYDVQKEQSFAYQKLQGNSVLLYCTEELQYLPWSWNKPNKFELDYLQNWVVNNSKSIQPELQFLAAVIWIGLNLGRTIKRTLNIFIGCNPKSEWSYDPQSHSFVRIPPRRTPGWRPKTEKQREWINPQADKQVVLFPLNVGHILKSRFENLGGGDCIGDLWDESWSDTVEQLFVREFSNVLPRITGSMLANVLPQKVFEGTNDHIFSRLLSSHHKSALPSGCAYSSWTSAEVDDALNKNNLTIIREVRKPDNAMGSLLDPIEKLLINSIRSAKAKILKLKNENDLVAFHNAYTAYNVVALLAATGGRPINDPFENRQYFDFEEEFVYITDKVSGELRQARLVPLVSDLCKSIQQDYLSHIDLLVKVLGKCNPLLAEMISNINSKNKTIDIPFFFFLSENAGSWKSVTEREIELLDLFDWPLPLNHFRHRLSRKLRDFQIDPELIDAVLGHAEIGSATHSDYSFRIWDEDMNIIRPAMQSIYDSLGFERIGLWQGDQSGILTTAIDNSVFLENKSFGILERDKKRRKRFRIVVADAKMHIQQFLGGRETIAELSENELDQLTRELLFNQKGTPHVNGYLKYRVLLKRIERELVLKGKKAKISKRYQSIPEEVSAITTHAPGALALYKKLKEKLADIPEKNIGRIGIKDCAVISAVLLCIENKISNKVLLNDILHAKNYRLVTLKNKPYLEYVGGLNILDPDIPTQRFAISDRTALYLDHVFKSNIGKSDFIIPRVVMPLKEIIEETGRFSENESVYTLIENMTLIVDQVNSISLPGMLAGYLGGRVKSYSLTWRDWAKLVLNEPINPDVDNQNDLISESELENQNSELSIFEGIKNYTNNFPEEFEENAHEFINDIYLLLNESNSIPSNRTSPLSRKELSRKIKLVLEKYDGKISSSIFLLGRWIAEKLFKKVKGRLIALSTLIRYLGALSPSFKGVAYSANLVDMDNEDITALYSNILITSKAKDTQYVAERLHDFHKWAKREYAVADPDWQELPEIFSTGHVSPGLITEKEYQSTIQLLHKAPDQNSQYQLATIIILLLAYRFGLRGGEAIGLLCSDLIMRDSGMIVLVQNNRFRKLKTVMSRRQIPLLANMSEMETALLSKWMGEVESQFGNNKNVPLFSDASTKDGLMDAGRIKKKIIIALKICTSNNQINLHHARHSVANIVALSTLNEDLPIWRNVSQLIDSRSGKVEKILLGREGSTRRKMWATSRFLGHVRRETTCGYYLHFMGELYEKYVKHNLINNRELKLKNAIEIDDLPRVAKIETGLLEQFEVKFEKITTSRVLKLMRLLARGKDACEAAESLTLPPALADEIVELLKYVGETLRKNIKITKSEFEDAHDYLSLIKRLKEPAWNRIIEFSLLLDQNEIETHNVLINLETMKEMIGSNRQILLWEKRHFELLSAFIIYIQLKKSEYTLVKSRQTSDFLECNIKEFEFDPVDMETAKKNGIHQIDKAVTADKKYTVQARCAFVVQESNYRALRNSVEMLVAFVAFGFSNQDTPISPNFISSLDQ
jgi:integrase